MDKFKLQEEDIELLNSKIGLYTLLRNENVDIARSLDEARYTINLKKKQEELIELQNWVIREGKKVVIIFEGMDAAGKTGAIRRITEYINPRHFKVVALNKATTDESQQWYFQRYINQLPKPGQIVFFDRSWYNRAVLEPVNKFCNAKEYRTFMSQVNNVEKMIVQSDTCLLKLYFSISKKEQAKRFSDVRKNPLERWKMTPLDVKAQSLWDDYMSYTQKMFEKTGTKIAPWKVIDASKRTSARLSAISYILDSIPYK